MLRCSLCLCMLGLSLKLRLTLRVLSRLLSLRWPIADGLLLLLLYGRGGSIMSRRGGRLSRCYG